MSLGQRIRTKRKEKKLTQLDIARRLGIDNTTVSKWESDLYEPDAENLSKLAELLEITTDYLLTGRTESDLGQADDLTQEEREFLEILRTDPDSSSFFYDYSKAPAEQRREMIKTWRIIRELEKDRKPGQKQGNR